jgi:hypothetical protein
MWFRGLIVEYALEITVKEVAVGHFYLLYIPMEISFWM